MASPLDQTSNEMKRVDPHRTVAASSGISIHRDTNFFFLGSRPARTRDHRNPREQGNFASPSHQEPSSNAQLVRSRNDQRGRQPLRRSLLRKCLSLHLLWLLPLLWLLLVPLIRHLSNNIVSTPHETKFAAADDNFAPTLSIQSSIEAALISTQIPRKSNLHELSAQAALDRQTTILSHDAYSSHLNALFATTGGGRTQEMTTTTTDPHSTLLLDKTIETLLFYTCPWANTDNKPWHKQTRSAIARATHLTDHDRGLPALTILHASYSANLTQWIDTMGQISAIIATEHEARQQL
ncbi:MAG: hypothetical protein LQ346_009085, partial [Caloplaca aetnensis]